jgi:hypothetical protein
VRARDDARRDDARANGDASKRARVDARDRGDADADARGDTRKEGRTRWTIGTARDILRRRRR